MTRHFLQLYLLIVLTLAAVSWGQNRIWDLYERQSTAGGNTPQTALLTVVERQLQDLPRDRRPQFVTDLAQQTKINLELLDLHEIAAGETHDRLARGEVVWMSASGGEAWLMKGVQSDDRA